jgi:integrase
MMRWSEIDFSAREWRYVVSKTKQEHIVPLSRQVMELLSGLDRKGEFVYPHKHDITRPMGDGWLGDALRRIGYTPTEMHAHGYRAMARTLLDEQLHQPVHLIEHQLSHVVRDPLGRAYNRTSHLAERHRMMQDWSDYLDSLRDGQ